MKRYEIDSLPEEVQKGNLTIKQAVRIIWTDVYTNPFEYGLLCFTEDQKSDFLLMVQKTFESLFKKFQPGQVTFKTFITGCLANQRNAFLRHQLKKENERRSLDTFLRSKTEEETQKYAEQVTNTTINENNAKIRNGNSKDFADIINQETNTYEKKNQRVAELTALVLTMKACKDVDDETVAAVSDFTRIDKTLLYEKIHALKQTISQKDSSYQRLVRRRNNAFYFHRKYMQEMLSPTSTEKQIEQLKKKYEDQTKKWKDKNESLSTVFETPSNEEIAKSIGIKPRMVSFYINHAKEDGARAKLKNLYRIKMREDSDNQNNDDGKQKVAENIENQ